MQSIEYQPACAIPDTVYTIAQRFRSESIVSERSAGTRDLWPVKFYIEDRAMHTLIDLASMSPRVYSPRLALGVILFSL